MICQVYRQRCEDVDYGGIAGSVWERCMFAWSQDPVSFQLVALSSGCKLTEVQHHPWHTSAACKHISMTSFMRMLLLPWIPLPQLTACGLLRPRHRQQHRIHNDTHAYSMQSRCGSLDLDTDSSIGSMYHTHAYSMQGHCGKLDLDTDSGIGSIHHSHATCMQSPVAPGTWTPTAAYDQYITLMPAVCRVTVVAWNNARLTADVLCRPSHPPRIHVRH